MLVNMSEEEWDLVLRVDLKGHFAPLRHAAAYWRDRAKAGDGRRRARRQHHFGRGAARQRRPGQLRRGEGRHRRADAGRRRRVRALRRQAQRDRAGARAPR